MLNKLTLNKSKLSGIILSLLSILLLQLFISPFQKACGEESSLQVILQPNEPAQGNTVSIKVKRLKNDDLPPKIYFDKLKLPVFALGDLWYRSFFPLTASHPPGEYTVNVLYGGEKKKVAVNVKETKYKVEEITFTKEVSALKTTKVERDSVGRAIHTINNEKFWMGKFIFPSTGRQSTEYGIKRKINGVLNPDYFHKGLDFAVPEGSDVRAPEKGKVILAGLVSKGFVVNGNCIFIDHGHGVITAYLHLSKVLVKEGEIVNKGQIIGKVGGTGIATGPHLHWGMYVSGKPVEPLVWTNSIIE